MANRTKTMKQLAGSPWHAEKMTRAEGDPRRHRTRCIHYNKESQYCSMRVMACVGSAHCKYYKENEAPLLSTVPEKEEPAPFRGIKLISMDDIDVGRFSIFKPSPKKVETLEAYIKTHGELDKPVVVSIDDGRYRIEDNYLRYFVARKLEFRQIPARIGSYHDDSIYELIRRVGQAVVHEKHGRGHVKESSLNNVTIVFENGKNITFNIQTCVEGNFITLG